ncbi:hypothetical protein EV2_005802 [Malus domestica]
MAPKATELARDEAFVGVPLGLVVASIARLREKDRKKERRTQRHPDQWSTSARPTTIHGFAQSGDLLSFQKLLREIHMEN